MSDRRIALLFLYAFASMTLPVLLPLAMMNRGQVWTFAVSWWILVYVTYGLVQVFLVFPRMGSWAAVVMPQSGVRLPGEDLKAKLLSVNDERLPFVVAQDPNKSDTVVACWKIADENWIELFAARGLRKQYELKMKIMEEKGLVLAQDNFRSFKYTEGLGHRRVRFAFQFSFFKGIGLFQYERGMQYGVIFKNGKLRVDHAYNYKFEMAEVKNPIIEIVTGSGWEFRPVVFIR